jgi:hypothetical protein
MLFPLRFPGVAVKTLVSMAGNCNGLGGPAPEIGAHGEHTCPFAAKTAGAEGAPTLWVGIEPEMWMRSCNQLIFRDCAFSDLRPGIALFNGRLKPAKIRRARIEIR